MRKTTKKYRAEPDHLYLSQNIPKYESKKHYFNGLLEDSK